MSSLPYSMALSTPNKISPNNPSKNGTHPPKTIRNSIAQWNNTDKSVLRSLTLSENPSSLRRREFLTIGVQLGILSNGLITTPFSEAVEGTCEFTVSPSGLAFCDQTVGFGAVAAQGQLIKAHYVGKLEDGKVFDSSYSRGKPLTFRIGVGEVIRGWDQGILGTDGVPPMSIGGKRKLRIPPELGYGIRGAGCRGGTCIIPPNSVLLFDVEFVSKA